ncbi:MAG: phospho-N-acetylmuramoyl-pentapeptide-transferase [Aerococcus sp.]|nr:phospho-N-acetylmuramoyl-pentapeptide-transferase [Aerococcus sp.]
MFSTITLFMILVVSLVLTLVIMPFYIRYMHSKQFGQEILQDGPKWHQAKSGTPTMGGVVFILSGIVTLIIHAIIMQQWSHAIFVGVLSLLGFGLIGFIDDALKIFHHKNQGLTSKQKFITQIGVGVLVGICLYVMDLQGSVPLFGWTITNGFLVGAFLILWMVGFSNAYNLTDGLDGLAAGNGIISLFGYFIMALLQSNADVAALCIALIGGLLGFLFFNKKPAKIFMGDAGSLAIGGTLAVISVLLNQPWSLLGIGIIYVIETASVIIQVAVFQKTGHRVFRMTPIHHHFEMGGWSEWKVDIVFWSITAVFTALSVLLLR